VAVDMTQVPELDGWLSVPVAAQELGVSRQRVFQMIQEGRIKSVRQIPGVGERPAAYVVRKAEIDQLVAGAEPVEHATPLEATAQVPA
jgi:Helix-turn-helix domain